MPVPVGDYDVRGKMSGLSMIGCGIGVKREAGQTSKEVSISKSNCRVAGCLTTVLAAIICRYIPTRESERREAIFTTIAVCGKVEVVVVMVATTRRKKYRH